MEKFTPLCIPKLGAAVIHLTRGLHCLVNIEDWPELSKYKWNALAHKSGDPAYTYARRSIGVNGKNVKVMMHRQIMDARSGQEVDHRNHRGLDNRRCNLLLTDRKGNAENQRKRKGTSSQFIGVCWNKDSRMWQAGIKVQNESIYLGLFDQEVDAAKARDEAARKLCTNPNLNFP